MLTLRNIAPLSLALLMLPSSSWSDSLWNHNGSIMRLQHDGNRRVMLYEAPRQGMRDAGVAEGTLFFDGVRAGEEYHGTARVFSAQCPVPMEFSISGRVVSETRIVLEGQRPIFSNCMATGDMKFDRLEFDFISEAAPIRAPAPQIEASSSELASSTDFDPKQIDPEFHYNRGLQALADGEIELGLGYLREASSHGLVRASVELGRIYSEGQWMPRSEADALYFFRRAAESGHAEAQFLLADVIESKGSASLADLQDARTWYGRAAENGHAGAAMRLGQMLEEGIGGDVDPVAAFQFYELAAEGGFADAEQRAAALAPVSSNEQGSQQGGETLDVPSLENTDRTELMSISDSGRIIGVPIHASESADHYRCSDVIHDEEFISQVQGVLSLMSDTFDIPPPQDSNCVVTQMQADEHPIFANVIAIKFFIDDVNATCFIQDYCNDSRQVTFIVTDGVLELNFMVVNADARLTEAWCWSPTRGFLQQACRL